MKKLLVVLLVTVMIAVVGIAAIPAYANDGFAHMYYNVDKANSDASYVKGWTLNGTSTASQIKMTKFGYKLDERDPVWKVTDITDGTSFPNDISWVAYHNAGEGGIEAGFGGSFYRIQAIISKAIIEADYGITIEGAHKITLVAQFDDENNSIVNVFGACTLAGAGSLPEKVFTTNWTEDNTASVPVESNVTYDGTTLTHNVTNQAKDANNNVMIGTAAGTGNLVVVTTGGDPNVSITLPNIEVGAFTGINIRYRASRAANENLYLKATTGTTAYTGTAGAYCSPTFVGDGEWHNTTYYISSNNLSNFVNRKIKGIRIPGADGIGNYIEIESITFEHWVSFTSFDEVQNHKGITIDCDKTNRANVQLGDITQVAKDSIRMRGWVASPVKITEFGYETNGNIVFDQANAGKAATEAAVVNAGAGIAGSTGESVRFYVQNIPRVNGTNSSAFGVARLSNNKVVRITAVYYTATDEAWIAPPVSLSNSNVDAVELNGTALNDVTTINGAHWLESHSIVLVKGEQNVLNIRGWTQVANGTITSFGYKLDSDTWVDSADYVHERSAALAGAGVASANGFNYFNIPTANLSSGTHTLKFRVKALNENNEEFKKQFFTMTFRVVDLTFSAVNVTLAPGSVTDINFKINKAELDGATNISVVFNFNGEETVGVDSSEATDTVAVYKFSGIGPHQLADKVSATITATYGETTLTDTIEYSVKDYCVAQLGNNPDTNDALNTLIVDMLRYGAAAQVYTNYNTDALATDGLTADQLAPGTDVTADLGLTPIAQKITAMAAGEKKVKWTAAALKLEGNVAIILKLQKIDGKTFNNDLTVKYTIDNDPTVYSAVMLNQGVCQIDMPVNRMNSVIHAVVYDGDEAVSNTVNYSIASYAAAKQNETLDSLGDLVKAMIRFGNAAAVYQPAV